MGVDEEDLMEVDEEDPRKCSADRNETENLGNVSGIKTSLINTYQKNGRRFLNVLKGSSGNPRCPVMIPPVPVISKLSKYIDPCAQDPLNIVTNEIEKLSLDTDEKNELDGLLQYEAEVRLFRAFEKLEPNCRTDNEIEGNSSTGEDQKHMPVIIFHQYEYKHWLFKRIFPKHKCTSDKCKKKQRPDHDCCKEDKDKEGETDFLVIGENYFAIFEVKHCKIKNIVSEDNLPKGITQAERTEQLVSSIVKIIDGESIHNHNIQIFKFCAFPFITRKDGDSPHLKPHLKDSDLKVIFKDDIFSHVDETDTQWREDAERMNAWWKSNVVDLVNQQRQNHISENVREVFIGLTGAENKTISNCIKKTDKLLRECSITREFKKAGVKTHYYNKEVKKVNPEISRLLGLQYFRKEQQEILDYRGKHLAINGPAGSGKTKILQGKLLLCVLNQPTRDKPVLFSISHEATTVHEEIIRNARQQFVTQKIGTRKLGSEKLMQLKDMSSKKIIIFSLIVIDYPKCFLDNIYKIVNIFKDHRIFFDDIQCLLLQKTIEGFNKLMRLLERCSFVFLTMDVVQMFYYPSSNQEAIKIKAAIDRSQYGRMQIKDLHANLRNSYEVASLLDVLRVEFMHFAGRAMRNFPTQRFSQSHFIHGPRPKVHYIRSSRRGENLKEKMEEILDREFRQLKLNEKKGNTRERLTKDDFQILSYKGPKVKGPDFEFPNYKEYTTKIRYSYSREWPVVFVILSVNEDTIYNEFLSRLYLGASRARVYCLVIIYIKEGKPPDFMEYFLRLVSKDSMALVIKECRVENTSTEAQVQDASKHRNKKPRLE